MLQRVIQNPWFALVDFLLITISSVLWYMFPVAGIWILLLALLPWGFRWIAGDSPVQRTRFDLLMIAFLITAFLGYWAAYDKVEALSKFWLIVASILFYYALSSQHKVNWDWIAGFWFLVGVGISAYYILTNDFVLQPARIGLINQIGLSWMKFRPGIDLPLIHPNDASGLSIITSVYGLYFLRFSIKRQIRFFVFVGFGIVFWGLIFATSRGAWLALGASLGAWVGWILMSQPRINLSERYPHLFPSILVGFLILIGTALLIIPSGTMDLGFYNAGYDTGRRIVLLQRSWHLLGDFIFTGGGLGSFPGLYSHYILSTPFFYLTNSQNMFIDVSIEQGIIGGVIFVTIYLSTIWQLSFLGRQNKSDRLSLMQWATLISLIVVFLQGMVDDYIYGGRGTALSFFPIGIGISVFSGKQFDGRVSSYLNGSKGNFLIIRNIVIILIGLSVIVFSLLNVNRLRSMWYANIGAVQMSRIELAGFPTNQWADASTASSLQSVELSFLSSLQFDLTNRTANHRLGMISMLRRDFKSAAGYLETAHAQAPKHRGIIKSLGYCYVWLGDTEKAQAFLSQIPEARDELDVYIWWWGTQGRSDLSENANIALYDLKLMPSKP